MFLIDYPFASDLLMKTSEKINVPMIQTESAKKLIGTNSGVLKIGEKETIEKLALQSEPKIYCNSENSIAWIQENLKHTHLPRLIELCKDKYKFRELLKPVYPDFRFTEVDFYQLANFDVAEFGFPFILKPVTGFFSLGIHVIESMDEWKKALIDLKVEMEEAKNLFPKEVLDSNRFLLEELIDGKEYAVDAFFKADGTPEIVNIYEHVFASGKDVSDRLYFTSKKVFDVGYDKFKNVLEALSTEGKFRNFAMHIEFRINSKGVAIPIEANPMRFAGFCMGDMTNYSLGFNPYEAFFKEEVPDWHDSFKGKETLQYNAIIASHNINPSKIESVDYKAFGDVFSKLLHMHKIDFNKYPVFAFAFTEVDEENAKEAEFFLKSDMKEFMILRE
ncbi:MAG: ATP-grasp domain-containing protein [Bacteroidales bacterium]|nr:ATP-grasp domain-containing protein [Bacteroidales bacterium]